MLWWFKVGLGVNIVDGCIVTDRSTKISMTGGWDTTFTKDDRCDKDNDNHRHSTNADSNVKIILSGKHDYMARSLVSVVFFIWMTIKKKRKQSKNECSETF